MATVVGVGAIASANNAAIAPAIHASAIAGDLILACCFYSSPSGSIGVSAAYSPAISMSSTDCKLMVAAAYYHTGLAAPTFTPSGGAAGDGICAGTIAIRDAAGIGCYGPTSINASQKDIPVAGMGNPFTSGLVFVIGGRNAGYVAATPPATAQGLTWVELIDFSFGSLGMQFVCDYAPFSTNVIPTSKTITLSGGTNTSISKMFVVPDHASELKDADWLFVGADVGNSMTTDSGYRAAAVSWGGWSGFTGYRFSINTAEGPTVLNGAGTFPTTAQAIIDMVNGGLQNNQLILNRPDLQVTGAIGSQAQLDNYGWYCNQAFAIPFANYLVLGHSMEGVYTAAQSVALQQVAWNAKVAVDPNKWLESVTPLAPNSGFATDLLNAGITRYCDSFGVRASFMNLREQTAFTTMWTAMSTANSTSGYPMKPVIVNTLYHDYTTTAVLVGNRNLEFKSLLVWWAYVQLKRYAIDTAIYFSWADSTTGVVFDYFDHDGATYGVDVPYPYIFNELATVGKKWLMRNGDFEEQQSHTYVAGSVSGLFKLGWITYFDPQGDMSDLNRCQIVSDAGAPNNGTYCLKQSIGGYNRTRRVVEGLSPGHMYQLTGFAKTSAGVTKIQAMGYNIYNGNEVSSKAFTGDGTYKNHTVTFTPTKDWVVISLESDGVGVTYWDDVTLEDITIPTFKAHNPMLSLWSM